MPGRATKAAVIAAPAIAAAALLAGCGGSSSSTTTTGAATSAPATQTGEGAGATTTIAGLKANVYGTAMVAGKKQIDMEVDSFYFKPSVLVGTPGQKLTIHLGNDTSTNHNFTLDTQKINTDVNAGTKATVQVTFPASGVISFHCEYHKSLGMVGGLKAGT